MQNPKDLYFMRRCLELAMSAKLTGKTAVGSVVVRNDIIIAEGSEGENMFPQLVAHAEVIAIARAQEHSGSKDLQDCVLYTTVEPCFMCSFLIRESNIRSVVYGANAGEIGGTSSSFPLLTTETIARWRHDIIVRGGIMEEECLMMLKRDKRP